MRIDGQTKPAPHHYVEALFKRINYPNIEAFLKINKVDVFQNKYRVSFNVGFFNLSPLQNEEKLSFIMVSKEGVFSNSNGNYYNWNGHKYFKENVKDIFAFGEGVLESEALLFDTYLLEQNGKKGKLMINFGGRYSPRKSSHYVFDFTKMYDTNPNNIIIERNENKLVKTLQDEGGVDKDKIIEDFMKL